MHEEAGGQLAVVNPSSSTTFVTRPSYSAASALPRRICSPPSNLVLSFGPKKKKKIQGSVTGGPACPGLMEGTAKFGSEFPGLSHCMRSSSSVAKPWKSGFQRLSVALIQEPLPSWA